MIFNKNGNIGQRLVTKIQGWWVKNKEEMVN